MKHLSPPPITPKIQPQPLSNNATVAILHPYLTMTEQSSFTHSSQHKISTYYTSLQVISFSLHPIYGSFNGHHSTPCPLALISLASSSPLLASTKRTIYEVYTLLPLHHDTKSLHMVTIQIMYHI